MGGGKAVVVPSQKDRSIKSCPSGLNSCVTDWEAFLVAAVSTKTQKHISRTHHRWFCQGFSEIFPPCVSIVSVSIGRHHIQASTGVPLWKTDLSALYLVFLHFWHTNRQPSTTNDNLSCTGWLCPCYYTETSRSEFARLSTSQVDAIIIVNVSAGFWIVG